MRFHKYYYDVHIENADNGKSERYNTHTTYKEALREAKQYAKCINGKVFIIIRRGFMPYEEFREFADLWYEKHEHTFKARKFAIR